MLLNLSVKNFALIDDLDIDFNAGLTALTEKQVLVNR